MQHFCILRDLRWSDQTYAAAVSLRESGGVGTV